MHEGQLCTPRPRAPHLLEGVLKERLSGNADLHMAGQGVRLRAGHRQEPVSRSAQPLPHPRAAPACRRAQRPRAALLTWQRKRNWWYFQRKLRSYAPGDPPCLLLRKQQGLGQGSAPQPDTSSPCSLTARGGEDSPCVAAPLCMQGALCWSQTQGLNPTLGVQAIKPTLFTCSMLGTHQRAVSKLLERRSPAAVPPGAEPRLGPAPLTRTRIRGAGP